jgi:hypothetical protein
MAAYQKFEDFVEQLASGKHDLTAAGHVVKCALTNTTPVVTNTIFANITEIGAGNGYTAGGEDAQNTLAEATGTVTITCTKIVWTAGGGTIGPFQWVVAYNDTQTSPVDPLISFWDHGSAVTLQDGETFTVKFNNGDPTGTLFTLT